MAGFYPDVPNNRMAIDVDGTTAVKISDTNALTVCTQTELNYLNDETSNAVFHITGPSYSTHYFAIIFPELRDVSGIWAWCNSNGGGYGITAFWWSADTTNGLDGTWTSFTATASNNVPGANPYYRTAISAVTLTNVKAIKTNLYMRNSYDAPSTILSIHLYGRIAATSNRLEIWHPTLDQRVGAAYFDWGDVPRGSVTTKTFRVKNLSATLSANDIEVGVDILTDSSPSFSGAHTLSPDGTNYSASLSIGTLAAGTISGILTVKYTTPSNAQIGLWAGRLNATATTWS